MKSLGLVLTCSLYGLLNR